MTAKDILIDLAIATAKLNDSRANYIDDTPISEALALLQAEMEKVIGEDEVDETGMNATTQWGLDIEAKNQLRAIQRQRLREFISLENKNGDSK